MQTLTREMTMNKILTKMEKDLAGIDVVKEAELINQKKSKLSSRTRSLVLFQLEINKSKQVEDITLNEETINKEETTNETI